MPGSRGYNSRAYVSNDPGAFYVIGTADFGTDQAVLPSVPANSTVDYYAIVPNSSSQWKVQKSVNYMRSDSLADPVGLVLSKIDCIQPVYPGVNTVVAAATWLVLNGYLFFTTAGGTTATKFIGFSNFNTVKGATTLDGSVTWISHGKAALLRFLFANVSLVAATPVAQAYELFQN
jgi:hypothetical protein